MKSLTQCGKPRDALIDLPHWHSHQGSSVADGTISRSSTGDIIAFGRIMWMVCLKLTMLREIGLEVRRPWKASSMVM
jgi:hypothetical protein